MRKLILILSVLYSAKAFAITPGPGEVSREVRKADTYSASTVFQSTTTCSASNLQTVWVSSPNPGNLFAISITSAAIGNSFVEVWDGAPSTANARRVALINSKVPFQWLFNVSFSSWIGISNQTEVGGTPACVNTIFAVR